MLISLTVGKVDAGVAVLLTQDKRLIEFPSILLPPNITSGSIVDITVARNQASETQSQEAFLQLQDDIYKSFGELEPVAPVLRCRNATQTSVVLEWDPIKLATANAISLSLYRNGQKAGNIPRPTVVQSTKISGLAVDTEYTFHLVLRTTAGTFPSEKMTVKTHKMTDLSGITVTPGILPAQLRDSLTRAVERIGAKMADTVRIDTTHFVTTEGRGIAWEKAVEMNIPVVRPEWIEGCERGGRIVGVRQYYLNADPRERTIPQSVGIPREASDPAKAESTRLNAPLPKAPVENNEGRAANGSHEPSGDARRAAEAPTKEAETETDDDDEGEEEQATRGDEQKVRVEDMERHKVMIPSGEADAAASSKAAVAGEGESGEEEGAKTPGGSFQDVAL